MYDNLKNKIRVRLNLCRTRKKNASIGETSIIIIASPLPPQPQKLSTIIPMIQTTNSFSNITRISPISRASTHNLAIPTRISNLPPFGILSPDRPRTT